MADEPNAIAEEPTPELETPASEAPADPADLPQEGDGTDAEPEQFDEDGNPIEAPAAPEEDDSEEFELDGKTFKAPKALKDRMLMHEDYTRKTQALAAKARDFDVARQISDAELGARAQIAQIDATIKEWEKVDWEAYENQDPLGAAKAWRNFQQVKDSRSTALTQLSQAEQTRTHLAQQDFAKRAEETARFAAKNIKGWTPKLGDEIYTFCKENGLSDEGIRNSLSPEFLKFANWARLGRQMEQRAAAPKPKPAVTPQLQPLQTVRGKSSPGAARSLTQLAAGNDMDAFAKAFLPKVNARR